MYSSRRRKPTVKSKSVRRKSKSLPRKSIRKSIRKSVRRKSKSLPRKSIRKSIRRKSLRRKSLRRKPKSIRRKSKSLPRKYVRRKSIRRKPKSVRRKSKSLPRKSLSRKPKFVRRHSYSPSDNEDDSEDDSKDPRLSELKNRKGENSDTTPLEENYFPTRPIRTNSPTTEKIGPQLELNVAEQVSADLIKKKQEEQEREEKRLEEKIKRQIMDEEEATKREKEQKEKKQRVEQEREEAKRQYVPQKVEEIRFYTSPTGRSEDIKNRNYSEFDKTGGETDKYGNTTGIYLKELTRLGNTDNYHCSLINNYASSKDYIESKKYPKLTTWMHSTFETYDPETVQSSKSSKSGKTNTMHYHYGINPNRKNMSDEVIERRSFWPKIKTDPKFAYQKEQDYLHTYGKHGSDIIQQKLREKYKECQNDTEILGISTVNFGKDEIDVSFFNEDIVD
jgi:hypothetical protein